MTGALTAQTVADQRTNLPALTGLRMSRPRPCTCRTRLSPENLNPTVATFMSAGYNGVTLFFVLSGFVLGLNYFDRLATPNVRGTWGYQSPVSPASIRCTSRSSSSSSCSLAMREIDVRARPAFGGPPSLVTIVGDPARIQRASLVAICRAVLVRVLPGTRDLHRAPAPNTLLVVAALILCVLAVFAAAALFIKTDRDVLLWTNPGSAHRWLYTMPLTRLGDFTAGLLLSCLFRTFGNHRRVTATAPLFAVIGTLSMVGLMCSKQNLFSAWSWDAAYLVPAPRSSGASPLPVPEAGWRLERWWRPARLRTPST